MSLGMTYSDLAMVAIGALGVALALLAVSSRRIIHAALALVGALGVVAVIYAALGSWVVALTQILVYVGAVVVLVVFALMVTRAPIESNPNLSASRGRNVVGAVAGIATTATLIWAMYPALSGVSIASTEGGDVHSIAQSVFVAWLVPFELLSFVLLAALVAALVVADRDAPMGLAGQSHREQSHPAQDSSAEGRDS